VFIIMPYRRHLGKYCIISLFVSKSNCSHLLTAANGTTCRNSDVWRRSERRIAGTSRWTCEADRSSDLPAARKRASSCQWTLSQISEGPEKWQELPVRQKVPWGDISFEREAVNSHCIVQLLQTDVNSHCIVQLLQTDALFVRTSNYICQQF
jgi:hypothetical protein